ncbi:MAG: glucosamine-6-phosphate deaminase [Clostridia bacterium]|nr:glucosamine-6-phosphate deaminase [Clostridia bacterium]
MQLILCDNYADMSEKCAEIFAEQIRTKKNSVLGLATGSTPIVVYEKLAELYKKGELDFSEITTFNLDEYYPLAPDNDQSYHYFMNEHLFSKVNIKPENTNIIDGLADDPNAECKAFEEKIASTDGIDLQLLGVGVNGHIGFNEPDDALIADTHITDLTQSTIEANARFFNDISEVPTKALTMGIASILKSKKIVILASGKSKHEAVKAMLNEKITTATPATMLKVHPDVILICDKEAYNG